MRNASLEAFLANVQNDESLRNELRAACGDTDTSVEALVAFAASKGYEFEVADFGGELTDQQLDAVAGGLVGVNKKGGHRASQGELDDCTPASPIRLLGSIGERQGDAGSTILSALAQQTSTDSES